MTRKVAAVLGVGPGLGAAVSRRFAREGSAVALMARSEALAEEADYLMEDLEKHREHVAAQLAYVLVDSERKRAALRCVR